MNSPKRVRRADDDSFGTSQSRQRDDMRALTSPLRPVLPPTPRRAHPSGPRLVFPAVPPSLPYMVVPVPADRLHAKPVGGRAKRILDILLASSALLVMAPMMLMLAVLILVTMGRPVFFIQQRVGYGRRTFGCFKFRSMVADAQERLERLLAEDSEAARLWTESQKLSHDPRITWLGHIMRKTSLDELPQFFNVLRGDMSCVGPRPVLASELLRYGPYAQDYASTRPGLTGLWQVSGRSDTTYGQRVNLDRVYVRRWSLGLDIKILARTIPAVLRVRETS